MIHSKQNNPANGFTAGKRLAFAAAFVTVLEHQGIGVNFPASFSEDTEAPGIWTLLITQNDVSLDALSRMKQVITPYLMLNIGDRRQTGLQIAVSGTEHAFMAVREKCLEKIRNTETTNATNA